MYQSHASPPKLIPFQDFYVIAPTMGKSSTSITRDPVESIGVTLLEVNKYKYELKISGKNKLEVLGVE